MKISTFWIILLRVLGLYMLYLLLTAVLFLVPGIGMYSDLGQGIYVTLFTLILFAGLFLLILRFIVIHPTFLIDKFRLNTHFQEETINVSTNQSALVQIALIVIGGLSLMDGIPFTLRSFITMMQNDMLFFNENPELASLIEGVVMVIVGFLLVTRSRAIAEWIDRKSTIVKETID